VTDKKAGDGKIRKNFSASKLCNIIGNEFNMFIIGLPSTTVRLEREKNHREQTGYEA